LGGDAGLRIDFSRRPRTGRTVDPRPLVACRVAVPWRGGQRSLSKVTLTVSAENLPVTVDGGARLDPDTLAGVLPEKLPSGISTKFCIGMAVLRACETVPDNWPRALVTRTSHSPQKREPGTRVPCTVQVPSASWTAGGGATGSATGAGGAAAGAAGAAAGGWQALCIDTHPAKSRKRNDTRDTVRLLRFTTCLPDLEAPASLEDKTAPPLGVFSPGDVRPVPFQPCNKVDRRITPPWRRFRSAQPIGRDHVFPDTSRFPCQVPLTDFVEHIEPTPRNPQRSARIPSLGNEV